MCPCDIQCTVIRSNGIVESDCTTDDNVVSSFESRYVVFTCSDSRNSSTC